MSSPARYVVTHTADAPTTVTVTDSDGAQRHYFGRQAQEILERLTDPRAR